MLQLAQRTSAPSSTSVSMRTAVWIVMCSEPEMRAPASGLVAPNSARRARSPGISCSASNISLRPNGASDRSATRKSRRAASVELMGWSPRQVGAGEAGRGLLAPIGSARRGPRGYRDRRRSDGERRGDALVVDAGLQPRRLAVVERARLVDQHDRDVVAHVVGPVEARVVEHAL